MTGEQFLAIDSWIREAQEVSRLLEDIESRIKNKNLAQEHRIQENAKPKLFEVGVKLDRLESLLHNPPSRTILTKEDMKFRWELLSDYRLRTRALAFSLYSSPSTQRAGGLPVASMKEPSKPTKSDDEDHMSSFSKDDPEMLKPLTSEDATQSEVQMNQSGSCTARSVLSTVCWIVCLILGAAVILVLLIIICAAI